jgi:hypothetical protein
VLQASQSVHGVPYALRHRQLTRSLENGVQGAASHILRGIWPRLKGEVEGVVELIKRHTELMRSGVRVGSLQEEHEYQRKMLEEREDAKRERMKQEYGRIKTHVDPRFYNKDLTRMLEGICKGTGDWLLKEDKFTKWLDFGDSSTKVLWFKGIPGAGTSFTYY